MSRDGNFRIPSKMCFPRFYFFNIANKPVCVMSFMAFLIVSLFGYVFWLYWPVRQD